MEKINSYKELRVYQGAIELAVEIFELTKHFPTEERYSMTDQIRRSSRSVCANIGEAWRKRRYPAHFVSKLSDSEAEAEETRVWIEIAQRCDYLKKEKADNLDDRYDKVLGQLVLMINSPEKWTL
jgi:four helix bundle protein